ncbi:MAG: LysR substrate-binding domain-containing protein [Oxalobacteraceae bacterium]
MAVRTDYSAAATTSLALLEADVGILYHSLSHPAIREQLLGMSELVLIGHPSSLPLAPSIGLDALGKLGLIGPDAADPVGKMLTEALRSQNIQLDIRITAQSYRSVVSLVEKSKGVGIVDAVTAISARERGLRVIPIRPNIELPIVAPTASGGSVRCHLNTSSPPVKRFSRPACDRQATVFFLMTRCVLLI